MSAETLFRRKLFATAFKGTLLLGLSFWCLRHLFEMSWNHLLIFQGQALFEAVLFMIWLGVVEVLQDRVLHLEARHSMVHVHVHIHIHAIMVLAHLSLGHLRIDKVGPVILHVRLLRHMEFALRHRLSSHTLGCPNIFTGRNPQRCWLCWHVSLSGSIKLDVDHRRFIRQFLVLCHPVPLFLV